MAAATAPWTRLYAAVVDLRTGSGWRVPALDGLRGVAALMVLVAHVRQAVVPDDALVWAPIERGGLGGVVLFFALSGFLLYLPWLRAQLERRPPPRFRVYAIRRCLRIMPAYYATVILFAITRVVIGGRDPIGADALLLHFVFLPTLLAPLQTVYWTLQVEELFYWVLPALHRLVAWRGAARVVSLACVIAGVWGAIGLLWIAPAHRQLWLEQTPFFLPAFALGIATAVRWTIRAGVLGGGTLVALGAGAYVIASPVALYVVRAHPELTPVTAVLLAPAASLVVLGVARGGAPLLEHPALRFLGGISFSLYLLHLAVIKIVPVPAFVAASFGLRLAFTLAVAVPLATLSYLLIERPFLLRRPAQPTEDQRLAPDSRL